MIRRLFSIGSNRRGCTQAIACLITLCMKLPWFRIQTAVPDPFIGGKSAVGSKDVVPLLLPQMAENSDTLSALLGENELQQLSNKWRNKNTKCSTKLKLILVKLGQLNIKRMLTWMSISYINLIKHYVNFMENFEELMERYCTLIT